MHTIKSFKGYGKVDEAEQQAFKNKIQKRIILISISTVILLAIIIATITITVKNHHNNSPSPPTASPSLSPAQSLKAVCAVTQYPSTCFSSLSPHVSPNTTSDPEKIFSLSLQVARNSVLILPSLLHSQNNTFVAKALKDCRELFVNAADLLDESQSSKRVSDLRTWLTAAMTDQETCLEGLSEINKTTSLVADLRAKMQNSTELISNSLAIVTKIISVVGKFKNIIPNNIMHRKLLGNGIPEWVGEGERRVLLEGENVVKPDVVVAKDGSGNFMTIGEAIKGAPVKSERRYVIYVKEGVYEENVVMGKNVWNVMMYGDGMDKSVISSKLNFIDGTPTFSTATFAVAGRGFIAKDMGFKNAAGAEKHQAVAFRSGSDHSIFYRCLFDGHQDTLYAHSNRQFYRECTITGTIDFIFGNAAVVFQNCNIHPRQPMPRQFNTITAQGKKDPNQNTGISIQKCTISALGQVTAPTYLGRPWREFATTVVMQSDVGPVLHPLGWIGWVNGVEPAKTIFYAEYGNTGPGADVSKRVQWAGYKPMITADEASKYTVGNFIGGSEWLGDSNVAFETTL